MNKVLQVITRVYKNALQSLEALQPYFKESEGISRTSLRCSILTRFAVEEFFPMSRLTQEIKKKFYQRATFEEYFPTFLNQEFLFFVHK